MGTGTGTDRIGYRGEFSTYGYTYLRARIYDPVTGQFTAQDPLDGVNGTSKVGISCSCVPPNLDAFGGYVN